MWLLNKMAVSIISFIWKRFALRLFHGYIGCSLRLYDLFNWIRFAPIPLAVFVSKQSLCWCCITPFNTETLFSDFYCVIIGIFLSLEMLIGCWLLTTDSTKKCYEVIHSFGFEGLPAPFLDLCLFCNTSQVLSSDNSHKLSPRSAL